MVFRVEDNISQFSTERISPLNPLTVLKIYNIAILHVHQD